MAESAPGLAAHHHELAAPVPLAHHFEDLDQQHEAASLGMWTFLATEVMFFGGLICGFIVYRSVDFEAFAVASRELNVWCGGINTVVLLTSSLTMALAVHGGEVGDRKAQVRFLLLTMLLGLCFLGIKTYEYSEEFDKGLIPGPYFNYKAVLHFPENFSPTEVQHAQLFFVFYFFMTGLHAFHMVIGVGVVAWIMWLAYQGKFTAEYSTPLEMAGLYWHFVDIVWVFLFPLLYLIYLHK
jgi:cytochrome c oxidase subunit III